MMFGLCAPGLEISLWAVARGVCGTTVVACALALTACGGGGGSAGSGGSTTPPSGYTGTAGDFSKSVSVAGVSRSYLLHVPASYSSATPSAAVLLLHGGGGSAATISNITGPGGLSATADRNNFITIYPDSQAGNWDDGRETITTRTNDVAFVAALLDALALEYNLDPRRVFATGISNGGMMTFRLGCELSSRIAAIATVAANMPQALVSACNPSRPMPLLMLSGTADPLMPYDGGTVAGGGLGGLVLSAPASASFWLNKNANTALPLSIGLPDTDANDGTTTDLLTYGSAGAAGEVAFYRINGGGHAWPGGTQYFSALLIGRVAKDFSGNDAIWAFFARHNKP
jgi:polyhydroxybutyrate depolymerase